MTNLLDNFEKVEVTTKRVFQNTSLHMDKHKFYIPAVWANKFNLKEGSRVDCFHSGSTFAFKVNSVGIYHIRKLSKASDTLVINSVNLVRFIHSYAQCRSFETWIDGDVLFFRPAAKEE